MTESSKFQSYMKNTRLKKFSSIPEWMAKASKNWPLVRFQTIRPSASFKKERTYIADALVKNFIKQVFVDNFFHADPHPGNILFYRLKQDDPRINELEPTHEFENQAASKQASKPNKNFRLIASFTLDFEWWADCRRCLQKELPT